jgi:hypothetical protein
MQTQEEEEQPQLGTMKHRRGRRGEKPLTRQPSLVDQFASRVQDLIYGLNISPSRRASRTITPLTPGDIDTPNTPFDTPQKLDFHDISHVGLTLTTPSPKRTSSSPATSTAKVNKTK